MIEQIRFRRWNGDVIRVHGIAGLIDEAELLAPGTAHQPSAAWRYSGPPLAGWSWVEIGLVIACINVVTLLVALRLGPLVAAGTTLVLAQLALIVITPSPAVLIARMVRASNGNVLRSLGWRLPRPEWAIYAVPALLITLAVSGWFSAVLAHVAPSQPGQCQFVTWSQRPNAVLGVFLVAIVGPLFEETSDRGFLYARLRSSMPARWAVPAGGGLFALSHVWFGAATALDVVPLGMILCLVYEYSGSLVPGAVIHGLFNLAGMLQQTHGC